MITFKELFTKTQIENNKDITHIQIANDVVEEFLKSDLGKDLHQEAKSILSKEEYDNSSKVY